MRISRATWLLLAIGAGCVALLLWRVTTEAWVNDDALISFRYADNLAAGHGLVYNPGERVEGFSNPLWTLLLVPFAAAGADLFSVSMVLGAACAVAELGCLLWVVRRLTGSLAAAAVAGALFATDRIVAVWSTGGLETSSYGLLITGVFALAVRHHAAPVRGARAAGLLLAALMATRPEGAVALPIYLAYLLVVSRHDGAVVRLLNWCVPLVALLLAARYAYFGDLLPNTYYAKSAGVPWDGIGLTYDLQFARRLGWIDLHVLAWIAVLGTAILVSRTRQRAAREPGAPAPVVAALVAFGLVGLQLVIVAWEGGDYMNDFRFLRPVMGLLYAAVGVMVWHALSARPVALRAAAWLAVAALACSHVVRQHAAVPIAPDAPPSAGHKRGVGATRAAVQAFAAALGRIAEPEDALVVDRAGARGFGHRYRAIDATGLVSRDLERDFVLRDAFDEHGRRERFPGHTRWPRVEMMEREQLAFIFPTVTRLGPEIAAVDASSPRRRREYPFFHVTMPLGGGEFLRFFTTWDEREIAARAARHRVQLCYQRAFGPLRCAGTPPVDRWGG